MCQFGISPWPLRLRLRQKFRFTVLFVGESFKTYLVVELGQNETQRRFKDRLRLIRREALFLNHPSITDTVYHIASHVDILALTGTDNPGDHLTGMNPDANAQRRG